MTELVKAGCGLVILGLAFVGLLIIALVVGVAVYSDNHPAGSPGGPAVIEKVEGYYVDGEGVRHVFTIDAKGEIWVDGINSRDYHRHRSFKEAVQIGSGMGGKPTVKALTELEELRIRKAEEATDRQTKYNILVGPPPAK